VAGRLVAGAHVPEFGPVCFADRLGQPDRFLGVIHGHFNLYLFPEGQGVTLL
jgi:hypothetical protein